MDEKTRELKIKVDKISSFIPKTFYLKLLIGFFLILAPPLIFTIIAIVASLTVIGMMISH